MLGGAEITARTREHAREMLEAAAGAARATPASRGGGSSRARSARARSASGR
jgi:hypothetical protein